MTTGNPYVCYPGDVNLLIKEGGMHVKAFVFANYTDSDHRCIVTDRDGTDVFNQKGNLQFEAITVEPGRLPLWELLLVKLDSGQLYIYLR